MPIKKGSQHPHHELPEDVRRQIVRTREWFGLRKLPEKKDRKCLKCEKSFVSHAGERLCNTCRRWNRRKYAASFARECQPDRREL